MDNVSTYTLRDYQIEGVAAALYNFSHYRDPFLLVAATGAGKSLMIADICYRLDEPVLVICPSKELLEQDHDKMLSYGITDIAKYSASVGIKEVAKYTFATIGSIYKKPELFTRFRHFIIDECHLVDPKSMNGRYAQFFAAIDKPRVMGLTATPYRLTQKTFKKNNKLYYTSCLKMVNRIWPYFFKKIIYKVEMADLIKRGYLCPIEYVREPVDMSGLSVNRSGSDYTPESLAQYWNEQRLNRLERALIYVDQNHKHSLTFCVDTEQAKRIQQRLSTHGLMLDIVTGETPTKERADTVAAFRRGETRHILNVGVFTTGFDVPELDCIVMARPTISLTLWQQIVGRGVRVDSNNPNKKLTVYDLTGVSDRLGRVETVRIAKETDGFRDKVVSELGDMTDTPLFTFVVKRRAKSLVAESK